MRKRFPEISEGEVKLCELYFGILSIPSISNNVTQNDQDAPIV